MRDNPIIYRAVYFEPEASENLWNIKANEVYFRAPVVSVTFGLTSESNPDYLAALEYLRDLGNTGI